MGARPATGGACGGGRCAESQAAVGPGQLSDFRKKLGAIKSPPGAVGTLGWSAQCVAWLAGREPRTDRPLPSLRIEIAMPKPMPPAPPCCSPRCPDGAFAAVPTRDRRAPIRGAVTLRRLSRTEYDRTLTDVLGGGTPARASRPTTLATASTTWAMCFRCRRCTCRCISGRRNDRCRCHAPRRCTAVARHRAGRAFAQRVRHPRGNELIFVTGTSALVTISLPRDGTYRIRLSAYGQQAGPDPVQLGVGLDTRMDQVISVPATVPTDYVTQIADFAGCTSCGSASSTTFTIRAAGRSEHDPALAARRRPDRARAAQPAAPSLRNRELPVDDPAAQRECATQILRRSGRLLYRRPLADDELASLLAVRRGTERGRKTAAPMPASRLALEAMLLSPHFLFRVELDDDSQPASHSLGPMGWRRAPFVLRVEQRRRDPAGCCRARRACRGCGAVDAASSHAGRPASRGAGRQLRGAVAALAADRSRRARCHAVPGLHPDAAPGASRRDAALRRATSSPGSGSDKRARPAPRVLTARFTYGNAEVARHTA